MSENNTNQFQQMNINTSSLTFFDEFGTMMKMGFLNENLSVSMGEMVENNGRRTYPKELRHNIIVTNERISALNTIITEKVIPAIASNEDYNGGVFTSNKKDSIFEIRVIKGPEDRPDIYMALHKNIDGNRIPDKTILFKFGRVPIVEKYDDKSGDFELTEIDAYFYLFVRLIEGALLVGVNASSGHSVRHSNRYTTDKIFKYLAEISTKLGVSIPSGGSYNNSRPYNTGFDASNDSDNSGSPVIDEFDNLEALF